MFLVCCALATELEANFNSVERLHHYTTESDNEAWAPPNDSKTSDGQLTTTIDNWPSAGKVEFRNYTMRYRKDLPIVLNNVNVTFPSGRRVGIVGRSGSGKSSMLVALFRMVEASEGAIFIDGDEPTATSLHTQMHMYFMYVPSAICHRCRCKPIRFKRLTITIEHHSARSSVIRWYITL
jgi:ABC-type multidrug transport system fused ATPase/permease subunit